MSILRLVLLHRSQSILIFPHVDSLEAARDIQRPLCKKRVVNSVRASSPRSDVGDVGFSPGYISRLNNSRVNLSNFPPSKFSIAIRILSSLISYLQFIIRVFPQTRTSARTATPDSTDKFNWLLFCAIQPQEARRLSIFERASSSGVGIV